MSMNDITSAIREAERFLELARVARKADDAERAQWAKWCEWSGGDRQGPDPTLGQPNRQASMHRAAARRASMDLTRALARFRRP